MDKILIERQKEAKENVQKYLEAIKESTSELPKVANQFIEGAITVSELNMRFVELMGLGTMLAYWMEQEQFFNHA